MQPFTPQRAHAAMLQVSVKLRRKRELILAGRLATLELEAHPAPADAAIMPAAILQQLVLFEPAVPPFTLSPLPPEQQSSVPHHPGKTASGQTLLVRNIRGRPKETLHAGYDGSNLSEPRQEELFFAAGKLYHAPPLDDAETAGASEAHLESHTTFSCALTTRFVEYDQQANIVHEVLAESRGVPAELWSSSASPPLFALSGMIPAALEQFRLGFELYQARFLGTIFGLIPRTIGRFYLTVDTGALRVFAEESGNSDAGLPLEQTGMFAALEAALSRLGLCPNLLEQVGEALKR